MIRVANQNFTVWKEITKGRKERLQNLPEYGERALLEFRTTPAQPVPFRAFGKLSLRVSFRYILLGLRNISEQKLCKSCVIHIISPPFLFFRFSAAPRG